LAAQSLALFAYQARLAGLTPCAAVGPALYLHHCWACWVEQRALGLVLAQVLVLGPVPVLVLAPILALCWHLL
jgi:hypothetical protein